MAFESLTDRLAGVFKKLRGHGKLTEADIKAAMREVRMALLEADVNYKVAKDFCAKVSERAMGQEVMESLTPAQQVVKIVNEELVALMGGSEAARLNIKNKGQTIIMLCGLQGMRMVWPLFLMMSLGASSPPIRATSSSLTILTTCWAGVRLSMTSWPMARSETLAQKSLATL